MKRFAGKPNIINRVNKDLIKDIVSQQGPISKPQIVKLTKLSLPTVNKIVDELVAEGLLKSSDCVGDFGVGRKPILYEANGNTGFIVALYIENEYSNGRIKGALVDLLGNIVEKLERKITYNFDRKDKKSIFGFIDELIGKTSKDNIKAISFGIPGVADEDGNIYRMPNILEWEGINLKQKIEEEFQLPTFVENDVNLTSVGVYNKFQNKHENIVYVYFGEGIGAGIIIKGKLFKGKYNFAGEISHLIIDDPESDDISSYKSKGLFGHSYLRLMSEIMQDQVITKTLEKNPESEKILSDSRVKLLIRKITHVLINMVPLLNPEVIAIRGTLINKHITEQIKKQINEYIGSKNCPEILMLEDGELGIEGTIKLGLSHSVSNYSFINDKGI